MRFHKTTEYAIRILVYLGRNPDRTINAREMHEALKIPYKYLTILLTRLTHCNLVQSTMGKYGGYTLNKPGEDIFLLEIYESVEDPEDLQRCALGLEKCNENQACAMHSYWIHIRSNLLATLQGLRLSDLINNPDTRLS